MNAKETLVQLPLLPLRGTVLFPHMPLVPLFVGRPQSVKAIEAAMQQGQRIMLTTQKDTAKENASFEDLYDIGCISKIASAQLLPDGTTMKITLEVLQRARIVRITELDNHMVASIISLPTLQGDDAKIEALRPEVLRLLHENFKADKKIPLHHAKFVIKELEDISDVEVQTDRIAANAPWGEVTRKQVILEAVSVAQRMEQLINEFKKELNRFAKTAPELLEQPFANGSLRNVFDALVNQELEAGDFDSLYAEHSACLRAAREYFLNIKKRPAGERGWPELTYEEMVNLYCASRVSDMMLLRFQEGKHDHWQGPFMTRTQYVAFWTKLGFEALEPESFHPFWCETVKVIESDADDAEIVEAIWPVLTLGPLMFARAGVKVRAPRHLLAAGVADQSKLHWSHRRRYRRTSDLSDGWGHNSQWGTEHRLDFDLGDRYVYNAAVLDKKSLHDLRHLPEDFKDTETKYNLSRAEKIDLLRHRSLTTRPNVPVDADLCPFWDYFEEPKR